MLFLILICILPAAYSQSRTVSPCKLSDLSCVRYYLARNSDCDPAVWGSVPNVVRYNNVNFNTPNFNCSFTDQYMEVRNLDKCYVSAFTFNLNRNRAVLAITCPNIVIRVNRALIQHYTLQEDKYYYYDLSGVYPPVIFTADLPHADELDVCSTFAFPYITGISKYTLESQGEAAETFQEEDRNNILANLDIYEREAMSTRSDAIFRYWVNNVLCNFNNYCRN